MSPGATKYSTECVWGLINNNACEIGHTYFALANTDQGAAPLEITCSGQLQENGKAIFAYVFSDWEQLESLIRKGTKLAIAVPMQSDQFTIWRFSLDGMTAAVDKMEADFVASGKNDSQKSPGALAGTL